jgi:hypothetical protein
LASLSPKPSLAPSRWNSTNCEAVAITDWTIDCPPMKIDVHFRTCPK